MIGLATRLADRIVTTIAARYGLRVLALELQNAEIRRDLATTRSDLDDLRSVVHEVYIGPIAGEGTPR